MHKRNPTSQISNSTEPQLTPWQAAVTLARLYGIAETLHPWPYLENEPFLSRVVSTFCVSVSYILRVHSQQEYFESDDTDLLHFFEQKIR